MQPGMADNAAPPQHFNANNNLALQEASLFVAGKLSDHVGSFVQTTYNGIDRVFGLDQMDLRYANSFENDGKDVTYGISLNNNPTVQDVFNTTATWRFPFTSSDLAPAPAVAPLIDGGLAQGVLGATAYALWIGRTPGGYEVYAALEGTTLSRTVNTLPTDGGPVYVTLWSLINGAWQSNDYIYNAAINP